MSTRAVIRVVAVSLRATYALLAWVAGPVHWTRSAIVGQVVCYHACDMMCVTEHPTTDSNSCWPSMGAFIVSKRASSSRSSASTRPRSDRTAFPIRSLVEMSGRAQPNLTRTLAKMACRRFHHDEDGRQPQLTSEPISASRTDRGTTRYRSPKSRRLASNAATYG
jgi:hypothetical protein